MVPGGPQVRPETESFGVTITSRHPQAPFVEEVFVWEEGRYILSSSRFPAFYQERIDEIRSLLPQSPTAYDYVGLAVRERLNYQRLGQPDHGIAVFEASLAELARRCAADEICLRMSDRVAADFRALDAPR